MKTGFPDGHSLKKRVCSYGCSAEHRQAMVGGAAAGAGRGVWNSKFDFSFAYFALTFGFQHLWRFPYLMFKNGGGEIRFVQKLWNASLLPLDCLVPEIRWKHTSLLNWGCTFCHTHFSTFLTKIINSNIIIILGAFLIPWLFCNIFVGFPLVLLEVAFGQHTGLTGPAAIGKAAPVLKGVGFSLLSMSLISNI